MIELLRLYGQIALLRRGPQDLPASPLLLALTVLGYFAVNALVCALLQPIQGQWLLYLAIDIVLLLAWYAVLLRTTKRSERFLQTATAIFGYQALLSPMILALVSVVQRFNQQTEASWLLLATIVAMALLIWFIVAAANIVKAALDWTLSTSVVIVVAQICFSELLMYALFTPQA